VLFSLGVYVITNLKLTVKLLQIHIFATQNKTLQEERIHKTKFNSALPMIIILRNAIFGKRKPDGYARFTLYINLVIWFTFLIWHLLSYFAFSLRDLIFEEKKIDLTTLIYCRGEELGFEATDFLNRILQFHIYSAIVWGVFFLGLVLLWRKSRWAIYTLFVSVATYYYLLIMYISLDFFNQDVTLFDKVLLSFTGINLFIYFIINRWRTKRELAFLEELKENEED
jgi:hypothetical protein